MKQEKVLNRRYYLFFIPLFLCFILNVWGCSTTDNTMDLSPEKRYAAAMEEKAQGEWRRTAQILETIETNFPYWERAPQSTLLAAQMYYKANRFDDTISLGERYIRLHPGHKEAEQAYYLIAQAYFNKIAPPGRDTETSEKALEACEDYLRRYPHGQYKAIVTKQKPFIIETLASKEMIIGRYYLSVNNYIPAQARFGHVVTVYGRSSQVKEALARLVEIYVTLGLKYEAQKTASMLALNAPDSVWYAHVYQLLKEKNMLKVAKPLTGKIAPLPPRANQFN